MKVVLVKQKATKVETTDQAVSFHPGSHNISHNTGEQNCSFHRNACISKRKDEPCPFQPARVKKQGAE